MPRLTFTGIQLFVLSTWLAGFNLAAAIFTPLTPAALIADMQSADSLLFPGPDTIDLGGNTFTLTGLEVGSPFIADGQNGLPSITQGGGTLTITNGIIVRGLAAPAFRLLHVAATGSLVLDGVTLQNGLAQASGAGDPFGGAVFSRGSLSINNSDFLDNNASGANGLSAPSDAFGGAIYLATGVLTSLVDSTFTNNEAVGGNALVTLVANAGDAFGGAIYIAPGASLTTITNSDFVDNRAVGGLAAIAALGNAAGIAFGGAIYSEGAVITTIETSGFTNNSAEGGNAVASLLAGPSGAAFGGAIFLNTGSITTIDQTTFDGNDALGGNAAVALVAAASAQAFGGALYLIGASIGTLSGSTFSANVAEGGDAAAGLLASASGGGGSGAQSISQRRLLPV